MGIFISFIAAALALAGSPGPNTLSLAAVGAAFGFRNGFGFMLGLNLGMVFVIAIVGSGVTGLLFLAPGAEPVIVLLAIVYFFYLAYNIATAPPISDDDENKVPSSWIAAVFISLANPKAYAAMSAMFSGFILSAESSAADFTLKCVILIGVIITVNLLWLMIGAALTPFLRDPKTSRIINICFALALILSVLGAAFI